uniref:hypothetical protein n=1 Tax=Mycolicibacterium sp. TaxID=2320850 RepID=UPI0037CB9C52
QPCQIGMERRPAVCGRSHNNCSTARTNPSNARIRQLTDGGALTGPLNSVSRPMPNVTAVT